MKNLETPGETGRGGRYGKVLGQTGRIGISTVYFKDNFSHTGNISYISNIQKGCPYRAAKQTVIGISILKRLYGVH